MLPASYYRNLARTNRFIQKQNYWLRKRTDLLSTARELTGNECG